MMNSSVYDDLCWDPDATALLVAWLLLYLVLLPLFLAVLCVGYTRRRSHALSHTDVFTYNIVAGEIINIVAACFYSTGVRTASRGVATVGDHLFIAGVAAQVLLHTLTCLERYLAVVHPLTYRGLKDRGGGSIRNAGVLGAWLLGLGVSGLRNIRAGVSCSELGLVGITSVSLFVVSFCSVSVLRVLTRPGPGEGGGALRHVDQSKRRALVTMATVTGVLLLRFVVFTPAFLVYSLRLLPPHAACLFSLASSWFYLPSSLVSPLMFLHRTGNLRKLRNLMNLKDLRLHL